MPHSPANPLYMSRSGWTHGQYEIVDIIPWLRTADPDDIAEIERIFAEATDEIEGEAYEFVDNVWYESAIAEDPDYIDEPEHDREPCEGEEPVYSDDGLDRSEFIGAVRNLRPDVYKIHFRSPEEAGQNALF